jgi:hypothetical protein
MVMGVLNNGTSKKSKNVPIIVATFVSASSQGQRMHSAQAKIFKIVVTYVYASSQGQRRHSARTKSFPKLTIIVKSWPGWLYIHTKQ